MCSPRTMKWIYWRPWWLTPTTTPRLAACWSPGTSSTTSPPLNRERGTLPGLYAALLTWPYIHLASSHYCIITIISIFLFVFFLYFPLIRVVSYLLGCIRLCSIAILSPPSPFLLLYVGYVMYLVKLMNISDVTVVISNVLAHIGKTGRTVPN